MVEQGHQGPDHPVHPGLPESDYLKAFLDSMVNWERVAEMYAQAV